MTTAGYPSISRPDVSAAALFSDDAGRVMVVNPVYKDGWDLPGGFAEPGEAPRAACVREVREELGIEPPIGDALVVDWAPLDGDRLLFVFDGGRLTDADSARIRFADGEISDARYVDLADLDAYVPAPLARRIRTAVAAAAGSRTLYAEHGTAA